jgi:rod shape-determining protein MreD
VSYSAARPLAPWRWLGIPAVMALLASLVVATPLKVLGAQLPEPVFALVPAFAWAVIRPSMLAPFVLLLMGVLLDALWGSPIGLWPVCLLLAYAAVLASRSFMSGQSPVVMWVWYAAVTGLAMGAGYLITMIDAKSAPSTGAVLWQFAWTAALYPFAHQLINRYEDADVRFK